MGTAAAAAAAWVMVPSACTAVGARGREREGGVKYTICCERHEVKEKGWVLDILCIRSYRGKREICLILVRIKLGKIFMLVVA